MNDSDIGFWHTITDMGLSFWGIVVSIFSSVGTLGWFILRKTFTKWEEVEVLKAEHKATDERLGTIESSIKENREDVKQILWHLTERGK